MSKAEKKESKAGTSAASSFDDVDDIIESGNGARAAGNSSRGLPMPRFSGEGSDAGVSEISVAARSFLTRFKDWAQISDLSDGRMAKSLGYALTGAASAWFTAVHRNNKVDTDDWPELEAAFCERFIKPVSPRYIDSELAKLPMKQGESVAIFLDRCELAQALLDDLWQVRAMDNHREARQESLDRVHEAMVLQLFLRNLRPDIRQKLNLCQGLTSLHSHVAAAEQIEKGDQEAKRAPQAGAAVAAIDADLNAINQQQQRQGSSKQGGKKKVPPPNYICRLCGTPGHFIYDCSRSDRQQHRRAKASPREPQQQQQQQQQGYRPQARQWAPRQQVHAMHSAAPPAFGAHHLPHPQQVPQPFHQQQLYHPQPPLNYMYYAPSAPPPSSPGQPTDVNILDAEEWPQPPPAATRPQHFQ